MTGYVMQSRSLSCEAAIEWIKTKRLIKPNGGFAAHLRAFEKQLTGVLPAPTPEELERAANDFGMYGTPVGARSPSNFKK